MQIMGSFFPTLNNFSASTKFQIIEFIHEVTLDIRKVKMGAGSVAHLIECLPRA